MLRNFADVLQAVKELPPRKVAVAVAQDDAVLEAIQGAREQGIADFILVGDKEKILALASTANINLEGLEIVHQPADL